jgi:hypothetical protein
MVATKIEEKEAKKREQKKKERC